MSFTHHDPAPEPQVIVADDCFVDDSLIRAMMVDGRLFAKTRSVISTDPATRPVVTPRHEPEAMGSWI